MSLLFWRDHQQVALVGFHRKVRVVDCHTDGLLERVMPSLNIQSPNSFTLRRENGMPGLGLLKRPNPKNEPAHLSPPLDRGCNALTTVEWLPDATRRILRNGQGLLLGNVIEGFVVHDDVFLNL